MRFAAAVLAAATTTSALVILPQNLALQAFSPQGQSPAQIERFLVETAPGETQWVDDEGKLDLLRVSKLSSIWIATFIKANSLAERHSFH
jgi:hypothetical protein